MLRPPNGIGKVLPREISELNFTWGIFTTKVWGYHTMKTWHDN